MAETTICGVDAALIERFLVLIRDHYRSADKAAFFLERKAGSFSVVGMTNLRDVLSHLATLLDPKTPPDERSAQLASAEEHLRRAIIEPYEIALAQASERVEELYERYKREALPEKLHFPREIPDLEQVNSALLEISQLIAAGKTAKARNLWDSKWEEGVSQLVVAFEKLAALKSELETALIRASAFRHERRRNRLMVVGVAGVIGTIFFGVLSVLFLLNPAWADAIRNLIGIR